MGPATQDAASWPVPLPAAADVPYRIEKPEVTTSQALRVPSVQCLDSPPMTDLDERGRPEPPLAAGETPPFWEFWGFFVVIVGRDEVTIRVGV